MPMTSDERARRAVCRAIDNLTDLVTVTKDDPNDPTIDGFIAEPDDLFLLSFSRVGLTNDAQLEGFKTGLKLQLPEIRDVIDATDLAPDVQIRLVWNFVRRELEKAVNA